MLRCIIIRCTIVSLQAGVRLGPYEIHSPLGVGGMGEVYRAHDRRLRRDVAIKVLRDLSGETESWSRFEREAHAASALNHPNICAIHDIGESDGRRFLVMELIEGVTLSEYINHQALDMATTLLFGAQIADALDAAHAQGILHRDIKPGNIMITARRHVKVLDFGLAKQATNANLDETPIGTLTVDGNIVGTPHYLAPELMRGSPADVRSDVWAMGVVLYEMLSGHVPFSGGTVFEISSAIVNEPVPPFTTHVPAALRRIVERCLAKRPEDRYQTAAELRGALEVLRTFAGPAVPTPSSVPHLWSSRSRNRWAWGSVLAATMLSAIFIWRGAGTSPPSLSSGGPPSVNQQANEAFELAMQFQGVQNDIVRANQVLERALSLDPRFAEALRYHATNNAILILNGYRTIPVCCTGPNRNCSKWWN